ncbi:hypothetical protein H072_4869 [Dactylellina haptotyla CBS 200.50]|uniref:MACPF domain-containing protein n=1 Tax=Dactylellina haptotyla (strain CBS 200.50) TaxID=1284197 RepID=S8AE84_DACHA|nr:hypothetical protein H072_4869 [Dactylellina haptotyla CBS 200.50]
MLSLKRQSLGHNARFGDIYNARTDQFTEFTLVKGAIPNELVEELHCPSQDITFSKQSSYQERLKLLEIKGGLRASVLSGIANLEGTGSYLSEEKSSNDTVEASYACSMTTYSTRVNFRAFDSPELRKNLDLEILQTVPGTHIVSAIKWGSKCIISVKHRLKTEEERSKIEGEFKAGLSILKGVSSYGRGAMVNATGTKSDKSKELSFEFNIHGDLGIEPETPSSFEEVFEYIKKIPSMIAKINDGRGVPQIYTLIPLKYLALDDLKIEHGSGDGIWTDLKNDYFEDFLAIVEEWQLVHQKLNDYLTSLECHQYCIDEKYTGEVRKQVRKIKKAESELRSEYGNALVSIRSGGSDTKPLESLLHQWTSTEKTPAAMLSIMTPDCLERMKFADTLQNRGAKYFKFQEVTLDEAIAENGTQAAEGKDLYVFYFKDRSKNAGARWRENYSLLFDLLENRQNHSVIACDCEYGGKEIEGAHIEHYRAGRLISSDLWEDQINKLREICLVRVSTNPDGDSAYGRVVVPEDHCLWKVPCPGIYCKPSLGRDWMCVLCLSSMRYAYAGTVYCKCGSFALDACAFKCNDPRHGHKFSKYEPTILGLLSGQMLGVDEICKVNILLLGAYRLWQHDAEFGDAFINNLKYPTLQQAFRERSRFTSVYVKSGKMSLPRFYRTIFQDGVNTHVSKIREMETTGEEDNPILDIYEGTGVTLTEKKLNSGLYQPKA